jgi:hypothetical protein
VAVRASLGLHGDCPPHPAPRDRRAAACCNVPTFSSPAHHSATADLLPRIEELIGSLSPELSESAVHDLLAVEVKLPWNRGDLIRWDDYLQRFPDQSAVVDEVADA